MPMYWVFMWLTTYLTFVMHYIYSISLIPYVTGSAQPKLNQDNMNKIPVPLPRLAEQKRIVEMLERVLTILRCSKTAETDLTHTRIPANCPYKLQDTRDFIGYGYLFPFFLIIFYAGEFFALLCNSNISDVPTYFLRYETDSMFHIRSVPM